MDLETKLKNLNSFISMKFKNNNKGHYALKDVEIK